MFHSYPEELATVLREQWEAVPVFRHDGESGGYGAVDPLPHVSVHELLLSVCYQASLMRDEGRPVTFRLILREPGRIETRRSAPECLHRIAFSEPRSFDEHELQRLSSAADFHRSPIGAGWDQGKAYLDCVTRDSSVQLKKCDQNTTLMKTFNDLDDSDSPDEPE